MTMKIWEVKAWCEYPGEFPGRSLYTTKVHGLNIQQALAAADKYFLQFYLDPWIVSIVRIKPPVGVEA